MKGLQKNCSGCYSAVADCCCDEIDFHEEEGIAPKKAR